MDDLRDHVPTEPVGATATDGASQRTASRRIVRTPSGIRLTPSRFPVYLGLTLIAVYVVIGIVFREPIEAVIGTFLEIGPVSWLLLGLGALALLISCLGPMAAYPLALRLGTIVDFDTVAGEVRITVGGEGRLIPLADVRALQVTGSAIGTPPRQVSAFELNMVTEDPAGGLHRTCLTCGGPKSSINDLARLIGRAIDRPVLY